MPLKIDSQREMACASLEPLQKSRAGLPKVYYDDVVDIYIITSYALEPQIGGKELANKRKAPQDD